MVDPLFMHGTVALRCSVTVRKEAGPVRGCNGALALNPPENPSSSVVKRRFNGGFISQRPCNVVLKVCRSQMYAWTSAVVFSFFTISAPCL